MVDNLIRFHCPNCQKRLKAGPEHVGRPARCTRCNRPVQVPAPAVEPPPLPAPAAETWWDDLPIVAGRPPEPELEPEPEVWVVEWPSDRRGERPTSPERERRPTRRPSTKRRAHEPGDLHMAASEESSADPSGNPLAGLNLAAANGVQAAQLRDKIRQALPEAVSAYKPSGRLPASGALCLVAGTGVGALAAGLARTVLMVIGVFAATALAGGVGNMSGGMAIIAGIALVIGALVYFAMVYVAAGVSAAWVVRQFGRLGKSRSPAAEAVAAAVATGAAILMIWLGTLAFGAELADVKQDDIALPATIEALIGGLIAVITAPIAAVKLVRRDKFCEPCEAHLKHRTAKTLLLADLYPAVTCLKARDLDGFRAAMADSRSGTGGKVEVFTCPRCRGGFVELLARCEFHWVEGKQKKALKAEWLVESAALPPEELEAATAF